MAPKNGTKSSELSIQKLSLTSDSRQLLSEVQSTEWCSYSSLLLRSKGQSVLSAPQHDQRAFKCSVFFRPQIMMNHVTQALAALCVGHCTVCVPALHVVWCQLPSPLPASLQKFAYKWTSKRALWHNWLAIRNFLELVTLYWLDQVCKMGNRTHTHTHTHTEGEKNGCYFAY